MYIISTSHIFENIDFTFAWKLSAKLSLAHSAKSACRKHPSDA